MRFIAKLLLPLSLILAWHCGANAVPAAAQEPPLKVLFIGNSYIYVNDLPGMIVALAEAAGGRKIEIGQRTPGGYLLQQHTNAGKPLAKIAPAEAKQLQAIAWQTVRDLAKNI